MMLAVVRDLPGVLRAHPGAAIEQFACRVQAECGQVRVGSRGLSPVQVEHGLTATASVAGDTPGMVLVAALP